MALDKQFLKYKLEKIKNDRLMKNMPRDARRHARKKNAKLAQEEADAHHSYITGEDNLDILDNRSFLENRLPGSFTLSDKGQLNIIQMPKDSNAKNNFRKKLASRFRNIKVFNKFYTNQLKRFKKIFDTLNIRFDRDGIEVDGDIQADGYKSGDGSIGISEDFIVTDQEGTGYVRKRIIVKNGLIVGQQKIS
tara:strand:+ start:401 stop:976 length:576 start_codon:yes stop_codon:yes gene_type:complete